MTDSVIAAQQVPVTEPTPMRLGSYDYADAFAVTRRANDTRTAEQWARATLEGSPRPLRIAIPVMWRTALRFRLGPRPSAGHVLGWRVVATTPEAIQMEVPSTLVSGELMLRVKEREVVLTTFLRFERPRAARAVWSVIGNVHRFFGPRLLKRAAKDARG